MRAWVGFGLLAVLGKTAFYAYQKRGLEEYSAVTMAFASVVVGGPLLVAVGLHRYAADPSVATPTELRIVGLLALVEVGSFLLGLFVLSRIDLSLLTPLKQTKPVVVALVEPLVFATAFEPTVFVVAGVAAVGGAVAMYDWNGDGNVSVSARDLGLIVVVIGVYTVLSLGARFGATSMPITVYAGVIFGGLFAAYLGLFVGRWLFRGDSDPLGWLRSASRANVTVPSLPDVPRTPLVTVLIAVALLGPFRSVAVWFAYREAPSAASVTVLTQLTVPLQVVVGGVALREQHTVARFVGGLLIVAGVLALVAT